MKAFRPLFVVVSVVLMGCDKNEIRLPQKEPRIVFLSNREAPKRQFDIFAMNLDGSAPINLTDSLSGITSVSNPIVSPDGKKIIYLAFEQQKKYLRIINSNGSNPEILMEVNTDAPKASFSPDGKYILFITKMQNHRQINIYDFEKQASRNISDNTKDEFEAVFSPAGDRIAFVSAFGANVYSIWTMNPDGTRRVNLSGEFGEDRNPDFSPDGKHIVFSSARDGDFEIYLMNAADGGNVEKLTDNTFPDLEPRFSPDGMEILFNATPNDIRSKYLFVFNRQTGEMKNITKNSRFINQHARFSPGGKHIVFEATDGDIHLVDIDGINIKNLTNNPYWDCSPGF